MRAVATDGRRGLEVVQVDPPAMPADGGLVQVLACGLCGSDVEKLQAESTPAGRVLGHEVVGLLETPDGGRRRVALAHHVPCGACPLCGSGHSSLCEQFLSTDLVPGGFADKLAVGPLHLADAVFDLPDGVDDLAGTLLEPLSCVLRAMEAAVSLVGSYPGPEVRGSAGSASPLETSGAETGPPGRSEQGAGGSGVLVAGCGAVGLLFVSTLALLRSGVPPQLEHLSPLAEGPVLFLEPREDRAALAEGLGAKPLEAGSPPQPLRVAFLTAPAALSMATWALSPGGTLVVFAAPDDPVPLDLDAVYRRELVLAGVRSGSPRHLRQAVGLLASGLLPLSWLEPEVVSFEGLPAAARRYAAGESLKVVLRP
jgi:L-iditol 2-dehydrogenase